MEKVKKQKGLKKISKASDEEVEDDFEVTEDDYDDSDDFEMEIFDLDDHKKK